MKLVGIGDQALLDQEKNSPTDKDFDELLRQLAKAREEHERLLEETKRSHLLLSEERVRREIAETKLQCLKNNLTELENALKEKERESRGFLLVSQNSLDEICTSFDNLLEMLDSVTRNPGVRCESEEQSFIKADIKTKMALLIRKTKSESFRRGYLTEEVTKDVKKLARSEADMRNNLPPINLINLERHIGDSPDIISPSILESFRKREDSFRNSLDSFRKMGDTNRGRIPSSATERARAIFSQILSGNMLLNLSAQ